jgi:hypothetical protein
MLDRRTPDYSEIWREKLDLAISDFIARRISDAVFTGTLYQLGFRGSRLREEYRYQEAIRHDTQNMLQVSKA